LYQFKEGQVVRTEYVFASIDAIKIIMESVQEFIRNHKI